MSFGSDLLRIAEKQGKSLEAVSRGVTLRLFGAVVRDTRVDTGRLRGNWQVTQDAPAQGEKFGPFQKIAQYTGGQSTAEAAKVKPLARNFLTNNLPYAEVWEFRDGMVGRAVADFQRIVAEEAAKIK